MAPVLNPNPIADGAILPPDAVYEILLRLPAKTLCRLRAVCRSWRSLTVDPLFVKAHEAHNPEPLLLVTDAGGAIHIRDLAGNVVKRACITTKHKTLAGSPGEHHGLICLVRAPATVRAGGVSVIVLDPAAGTVSASLPTTGPGYRTTYALGRVAATGEHKVLRILRAAAMDSRLEQTCDVSTLTGGGSPGEWRRTASPPAGGVHPRDRIHDVVIRGIAYFLSDLTAGGNVHKPPPDSISSFNLETEEWAPTALRGPLTSHGLLDNADDDIAELEIRCELSLAEVSGCLVTIRHGFAVISLTELWFLRDMDKGLWVKEYRIANHLPMWMEDYLRPLSVLDDGRVVLSVTESGAGIARKERSTPDATTVRVYDPRSDACTDVARMEESDVVGVYAGGSMLLRLRNR